MQPLLAKMRTLPIYAKPISYLLTFKLEVFKRERISSYFSSNFRVQDLNNTTVPEGQSFCSHELTSCFSRSFSC